MKLMSNLFAATALALVALFLMATPAHSQFGLRDYKTTKVWKCPDCGREVGRGELPPAIASCCGVTYYNGTGYRKGPRTGFGSIGGTGLPGRTSDWESRIGGLGLPGGSTGWEGRLGGPRYGADRPTTPDKPAADVAVKDVPAPDKPADKGPPPEADGEKEKVAEKPAAEEPPPEDRAPPEELPDFARPRASVGASQVFAMFAIPALFLVLVVGVLVKLSRDPSVNKARASSCSPFRR